MLSGLLSGLLWALNSVFLGIAMSMSPFVSTEQAIFLAPFISAFLNDFFSSICMIVYSAMRKKLKSTLKAAISKSGMWIVIASLIGGPIGMTGYVLSISYMGSSIASVSSAIYPAIGVLCARIFLKEKMRWHQYVCLILTMLGIYMMSYSPNVEIKNFLLGLLGTAMCAIGWGLEAVLIAKGMKEDVQSDIALTIRQTTSWLTYAIVILPCLQYFKAWEFTVSLFNFANSQWLIPCIMLAASFGTASYLLYYIAIDKIGATKALPLNVTYVVWTVIINLAIFRDFEDYSWLSYVSMVVVFFSSIFAAIDISKLRKQKE